MAEHTEQLRRARIRAGERRLVERRPGRIGEHRDEGTRQTIERVVEAGQRLLSSRFELLSLELKQTASSAVRSGSLSAMGLVFLFQGWVAGMIAVVVALELVLPLWAALVIVAGIHFLIGGVVLAVAVVARPRGPRAGVNAEEAAQARQRRSIEFQAEPTTP